MLIILLVLKNESSHKAPKVKVVIESALTKYTNTFSKRYTENLSKEIFFIDSVLKTNIWTNKIKDLNEQTVMGNFYEKVLLLSNLEVTYYPEPDSHIRY